MRKTDSKIPILSSEKVTPATQRRANELASCLRRITGVKFEVKTGVQGPGILVGTSEQFPTPSAAEGLRIYEVYDGRDAYAIRTESGCIKLLGATELGVSNPETVKLVIRYAQEWRAAPFPLATLFHQTPPG